MRGIAATLVLTVVGCSGAEESPPLCTIEGTYQASVSPLPGYNCDPTTVVTYRVTRVDVDQYEVRQEGGPACTLTRARTSQVTTGQCELWAKRCEFDVTIATTPPGEKAFVEYDWTFTNDGFEGRSFVFVPRTPAACSGHAIVEGKRKP